jgi:hypothetical protein
VPTEALYYGCLGCIEIAAGEAWQPVSTPAPRLKWWIEQGQWEAKSRKARRAWYDAEDLERFTRDYAARAPQVCSPVEPAQPPGRLRLRQHDGEAVVLGPGGELLTNICVPSHGNRSRTRRRCSASCAAAGSRHRCARAPGCKDLLKDILGADVAIVGRWRTRRPRCTSFPAPM